ncbi:glutathione-dependent formaldehyde dehydrogenase [Dyadobacter sp. CY345]|uniref:zinc-dependent alcohol dehydrogenase n=1 Tax=Dyadobacter sp. CY345 TaxID=2909335 RepID=UPI001F3E8982|nr:zinc-dependent alcohol dehydrogenase [Dyadobacter sp. CY345]MCF2446597.1 glutathione-dependent formaldehyde dehydrogenase [Dyadobacter sp. CY345]
MKAAVFHKPGDISVDNVPDPQILDPRDIILKVTSTAICGSDLHILSGAVPQKDDLVMGHEFMGIVEETGSAITNLKKGDRVVVPFPIACGKCFFCTHEASPACENSNYKNYGPGGNLLNEKGAALFGYTDLYGGYSGGQAQYVRVPYADVSPRIVPDNMTDEQVLFLTDIFPTGWSAIDWAQMKGGEVVAVFGCGPVGLMAQKAAWLHGASRVIAIDPLDYRLEKAKKVNNVDTLNPNKVDVVEVIRQMTGGRGADVCVDAVGFEPERNLIDKAKATIHLEKGSMKVLDMCFEAVRRMGTVSIVGVYGSPYDNFPLFRIFDKGITIKQGQAPVLNYIDHLIDLVRDEKVVLDDIITHSMPLEDAALGYKIFDEKQDDCVKVVLKP